MSIAILAAILTFGICLSTSEAKASQDCQEIVEKVNERETAATKWQTANNPDLMSKYKHQMEAVWKCEDTLETFGLESDELDICIIEFNNWHHLGIFKPRWENHKAVYIKDLISGFASIDSYDDDYQPVYWKENPGYYFDDFEKVNEVPLEYVQFEFDPESKQASGSRFRASLFGQDKLLLSFKANCRLNRLLSK